MRAWYLATKDEAVNFPALIASWISAMVASSTGNESLIVDFSSDTDIYAPQMCLLIDRAISFELWHFVTWIDTYPLRGYLCPRTSTYDHCCGRFKIKGED